jgi:hypothetical protein
VSELTEEERAWIAYRDCYQRERPWADARRAARQMRKRDFIAGYAAGRRDALREAVEAINEEQAAYELRFGYGSEGLDNAARVVASLGEVGE